MPREKIAVRLERGVSELQCLIREKYPDVEFLVRPRPPGRSEVVVEAYGQFEDSSDLTEIISERRAELFDETHLLFIFVARPYDERPSLKQLKTA